MSDAWFCRISPTGKSHLVDHLEGGLLWPICGYLAPASEEAWQRDDSEQCSRCRNISKHLAFLRKGA